MIHASPAVRLECCQSPDNHLIFFTVGGLEVAQHALEGLHGAGLDDNLVRSLCTKTKKMHECAVKFSLVIRGGITVRGALLSNGQWVEVRLLRYGEEKYQSEDRLRTR